MMVQMLGGRITDRPTAPGQRRTLPAPRIAHLQLWPDVLGDAPWTGSTTPWAGYADLARMWLRPGAPGIPDWVATR